MWVPISPNPYVMENKAAFGTLQMPSYITQHAHLQCIKGRFWNSTNTVAKQLTTWKPESSLGHKQTLFLLHFGGGILSTCQKMQSKETELYLNCPFPFQGWIRAHLHSNCLCSQVDTVTYKEEEESSWKRYDLHMKKEPQKVKTLLLPQKVLLALLRTFDCRVIH